MIDLRPLGDRAFLARFADETTARRWADAVRAGRWAGVVDVALAYASVAVFTDPDALDPATLESHLREVEPAVIGGPSGRRIEVPVLYDGDDLAEVAGRLGLTTAEVIAIHSSRDYHVFAVGFLPGFPYAGYLPGELAGIPRRGEPRLRVAAGSVAIAGRQTGIYPINAPGGWHLLGRTPLRISDLASGHFPIRAGDSLHFRPIEAEEYRDREGMTLN